MLLRLPCLLALSLAALPAAAAELRLLTPSLAYCDELSSRYARLPRNRQEVARGLAVEGARLCRDGYVRTGVAKLRRALRAAQPPRQQLAEEPG
ncbi:hypothetical protein [Pseudoroseomonas cervicalis]|uniref:hypothetical protein n=1 Tax=Teichococcus cervicalis TaxID=204525 RepID=UPI0022F18EC2|nr:hypothetical protein [Pseudoroseomonas cervicalis]WBV42312.1 hypothetical protein PFY06_13855 [Pseudoroseomonas cervicalis]